MLNRQGDTVALMVSVVMDILSHSDLGLPQIQIMFSRLKSNGFNTIVTNLGDLRAAVITASRKGDLHARGTE